MRKRKPRPRKKWATYPPVWLPFAEARAFVHGLRLPGKAAWGAYCRGALRETLGPKPDGVPSAPPTVYAMEWKGWGDWLGTGTVAPKNRRYRPFPEARAFARSLGLKSAEEWHRYSRGGLSAKGARPPDIPSAPWLVYAGEGWDGYGDWLGTGRIATFNRGYRPFAAARAFARSLGLKSPAEWRRYCQGHLEHFPPLPPDIPREPQRTFRRTGWTGYADWLGAEIPPPPGRRFLPFGRARAFARSLGLKSSSAWAAYCAGKFEESLGRRPPDIPSNPGVTYRHRGWAGFGDWLGTGTPSPKNRTHRPFAAARAFARSLNLRSEADWRLYCLGRMADKGTRPRNIPAAPWYVYRDTGWAGMGDWLGTGNPDPRGRQWRPFAAARAFARSLRLPSSTQWRLYCAGRMKRKARRPADIPTHPDRVYRESGWAGFKDWLGNP